MAESDDKLIAKKGKVLIASMMQGPLFLFVMTVPLGEQSRLHELLLRISGFVLVSLGLIAWMLWQMRDELREWRRTGKRPALR